MKPKEVIDWLARIKKKYINGGDEGYDKLRKEAIDTAIDIISEATTNPLIRCKDCKYQCKQFVEDRRMKEGGYWACGCSKMGELMGYWGWGGLDEQFCSDAERKER